MKKIEKFTAEPKQAKANGRILKNGDVVKSKNDPDPKTRDRVN